VEVLVYGYIAAMVLCAGISIAFDSTPFYRIGEWSLPAWIAVGVLGAVVWGGAMLLWLWLLNQLELVQASVSVHMLPVFGSVSCPP
jgi:drug/metabolite transporter (DMT)-like permease